VAVHLRMQGSWHILPCVLRSVSVQGLTKGLCGLMCCSTRVVDIDSWDGALEVIGWGETESGTLADDLMFAYVEVFDRSTCNMPSLYGPFIRDEMFCAGGKGREPCMADSGGPIVIPGSPDRLIGITSFGRFGLCGKQGAPAVYTLINPFIAWLREVTGLPSPSRVPSAQLPARNPPPTPPAPSSNGLHPSPAADKNLMLPGIVAKVIKVGLQAEGACLDGGVDWQPGSRASGCQHCNAYPDVATIARCVECCCGSGPTSQRWTYSGCPGVLELESQPDQPVSSWLPQQGSSGSWGQTDRQWGGSSYQYGSYGKR